MSKGKGSGLPEPQVALTTEIDFATISKEKEFSRFTEAIGAEKDPIMLVLRAHLYSENLLERLINFKVVRGDKLIENGNLTYHQKLVLVDALSCLPDSIISSLRNLNKLRNQCAHELQKRISETDITRIGSPLGKVFTTFKREAKLNEIVLLRKVISFICGFLGSTCVHLEFPELRTRASQTPVPSAALTAKKLKASPKKAPTKK